MISLKSKIRSMKLRANKFHKAMIENKRVVERVKYKSRNVRLSGSIQERMKVAHFFEDKKTELLTAIKFLENDISIEDYIHPLGLDI